MSTTVDTLERFTTQDYKWGFVTDIESESAPKGLNEDIVRLISAKKNEPTWLLDWRLKAYRHWLTMEEPRWWPNVHYAKIDYNDIIYYSAPKPKKQRRPKRERVSPCPATPTSSTPGSPRPSGPSRRSAGPKTPNC